MRHLLPIAPACALVLAISDTAPAAAGGRVASGARPNDLQRCLSHGASLVRRQPAMLPAAFRACRDDVRRRLIRAGMRPTDAAVRGAYAMAVANRVAPYGGSVAVTFEKLRREPRLDCDNYMVLAYALYRRLGGSERGVAFVGWDGGAVGNHAQLWIDDLLLDPTVGVAANIPLYKLARGGRVDRLIDLAFNVPPNDFHAHVVRALRHGGYRVSDALYRFTPSEMMAWVRRWRADRTTPLPTPHV